MSTHTQHIDIFSGVSTGLNLIFLIPNPSMQKHIIHSCSCKIHLHRYEASIDISTDLLLVLSDVSSNPQQIPRFRWYSVVYLLWSGEGKVFIMIPAHLVSSDRHTWHRDLVTPRHHSIAAAEGCHHHQRTIGTRTRTLTSHRTFTTVISRYIGLYNVHYQKIIMIF